MMWWLGPAFIGFIVLWCGMWVVADKLKESRPTRITVHVQGILPKRIVLVPLRLVPEELHDAKPRDSQLFMAPHRVRVVDLNGNQMDVFVDDHTCRRLQVGASAILVCRRTFWKSRIVPLALIPRFDS